MERELDERVLLVTGVGGDIGRALLSGLRSQRARVAASDVLDPACPRGRMKRSHIL